MALCSATTRTPDPYNREPFVHICHLQNEHRGPHICFICGDQWPTTTDLMMNKADRLAAYAILLLCGSLVVIAGLLSNGVFQ